MSNRTTLKHKLRYFILKKVSLHSLSQITLLIKHPQWIFLNDVDFYSIDTILYGHYVLP
jgi:hypothetical protein